MWNRGCEQCAGSCRLVCVFCLRRWMYSGNNELCAFLWYKGFPVVRLQPVIRREGSLCVYTCTWHLENERRGREGEGRGRRGERKERGEGRRGEGRGGERRGGERRGGEGEARGEKRRGRRGERKERGEGREEERRGGEGKERRGEGKERGEGREEEEGKERGVDNW